MDNTIEKQNEEALLNVFKIQELEQRLETAKWGSCSGTGPGPFDQCSS